MTVTLGERGVIDYDQVVTLPIKTSHTRTQLLGPHNDSHRDSSGSERGPGNLNSDPGVREGMIISNYRVDASLGLALRDGLCILGIFLRG